MRTILVTGGAGFIGSHIVEALARRGDRVRVLDDFSTGHRENLSGIIGSLELFEGNLLDGELLCRAMHGTDVVIHQAALASVPRSVERPAETHAACATGTLAVLDFARRAGVRRVVYAGSSSAYGDQPVAVKSEDLVPRPLSPYAAAKLAGEHYCRAFHATYGLEAVTLRYFNVFGPRQDPHSEYSAVIPKFVTAMLAGERPTIYGDGMQSRDFTYVENVVQGNLLAIDAQGIGGQVINVACGGELSLLELISALNRLLGIRIEPRFEPPRPGDVRSSRADITLAQKLLGYQVLIDFDEGLRRSIDFYRSLAG
jgi:UDP-glucose 4-epimerase